MSNLIWEPWIGDNFKNQENKILLIGESHYAVNNGKPDPIAYNEFLTNRNSTIDVIRRNFNGESWSLFQNLYRALFRTSNIDRKLFWSKVAFYNFIQQPMTSTTERPSIDLFAKSYEGFKEVIDKHQVTHCIFLGNTAALYFDRELLGKSTFKQVKSEREKVGRFWATHKIITDGTSEIKIYFIKHPSKYFSWSRWHEYLYRNEKELLESLHS